jgi:hypothetical protein
VRVHLSDIQDNILLVSPQAQIERLVFTTWIFGLMA